MKKLKCKINRYFMYFLVMIGLVVGGLFIRGIEKKIYKEKPKETILLKENLTFEINSEIDLFSLVSEKNTVTIVSENEFIDTSILGEKEVSIKYLEGNHEEEKKFKIMIVDTEAPVISYEEELYTTVGVKIDLLKDVKVVDNSKEQIQVMVEGKYDINQEGTYLLKYVAVDSSLNKKEESFILKVNKKASTGNQGTVSPKPFITVTKEEIENEKYYIPTNLERYMAYNDGTKTAHEIVTNVNCNIDRPFYTDIQSADVSKGYFILVNKYYAVDKNYRPSDLISLNTNYTYWENSYLSGYAYDSYIQMLEDGRSLGYQLIDTSNLRTYDRQEYLFNNYVKQNGLQWALKSSAKPGHSEHETGLASDIVKKGVSMYNFENTPEFLWLRENAHKYGFILRYPQGKEYLTGYKYEPWHYRYVGPQAAEYIYNNNIVFEEYYAYFCQYKGEC